MTRWVKPLRCWVGIHFWGPWHPVDRPGYYRLSRTCGRCRRNEGAFGHVIEGENGKQWITPR